MYLSPRGRYAIMALIDLCKIQQERGSDNPVTLAHLAERQNISLSYLEQLFAKLRQAGIVRSVRGPGGGYVLTAPAVEIWLDKVISATAENTRNKATTASDSLWQAMEQHLAVFLSQTNLAMAMSGSGFPTAQQFKKAC